MRSKTPVFQVLIHVHQCTLDHFVRLTVRDQIAAMSLSRDAGVGNRIFHEFGELRPHVTEVGNVIRPPGLPFN